VTADPELLDELLRLAAAGGTDLDVAPDPAAARLRFAAAPLVLIGADQADPCLRARLPRRPRVVIVGRAPAVETVWSVAELLGAEHVAMLPTAESWIIDRLTERHEQTTTSRVIAVIGGRGGAGASILAGGLAVTAVSSGLRTLLVDGDPLGGGLDLVLGWEQVDGLRWPGLRGADGRVDPPALFRALPPRGPPPLRRARPARRPAAGGARRGDGSDPGRGPPRPGRRRRRSAPPAGRRGDPRPAGRRQSPDRRPR
jgi:secretion/DNA translocation related CpaE-like protein